MTTEQQPDRFHFLEEHPNETSDEFLERRLSHMLERFSYERLSGCSMEELNKQIRCYNAHLDDMFESFTNPDFIFAEEPEMYEFVTGEELDLYDPLTSEQMNQINSVVGIIHINFDKAKEDARDRKINRLSMMMDSIPIINRLKR